MISDLACWLVQAYYIVLFAYVILSWVPKPPEPFLPVVRLVHVLVDPVVKPIRRLLPPLQLGGVGLDLSILVVFFALILVRAAVC